MVSIYDTLSTSYRVFYVTNKKFSGEEVRSWMFNFINTILFHQSYKSMRENLFIIVFIPYFISVLQLSDYKGFIPARSRKAIQVKMHPQHRYKCVSKIYYQLISSQENGNLYF